jgi:hypothetical protein
MVECRPSRGVTPSGSGDRFVHQQEKCMNESAIRLLVLALFAIATAAIPMAAPAKAATDGNSAVKKQHKRNSHAGSEAQAPKGSSQIPNMADDPNRRISY